MIRYTLKCKNNHQFDSWFQTAAAFEKLRGAGLVTCAVCGNTGVAKAIMAPGVRPARKAAESGIVKATSSANLLSAPASPAEQAMADLRRKIEERSENVGDDFAREARAIHDGDAPERAIIGEAKPEEARALIEDGVPVAPLPWMNRKSN